MRTEQIHWLLRLCLAVRVESVGAGISSAVYA